MKSKYLEEKLDRRVDRMMVTLPVIRLIMAILLMVSLLIIGKISCDYLQAQTHEYDRIHSER